MTNKPTVTAIISAYYAEQYLAGRIDNLLGQTLVPEIIVVCQKGSQEGYIATFPYWHNKQVEIIETEGIPTIYAAWNLALAQAQGEFVTNANCDDRLRPNALEILAHELATHPRYAVAYGDQEIVEKLDGPVAGKYEWIEGGYPELMRGCFMGPMPMWRRSLHDTYGVFDDSMHIAGDYEFWCRIASHGERFFHIRGVVGTYLKRENSAEHREPLRAAWETARIRARYSMEVENESKVSAG